MSFFRIILAPITGSRASDPPLRHTGRPQYHSIETGEELVEARVHVHNVLANCAELHLNLRLPTLTASNTLNCTTASPTTCATSLTASTTVNSFATRTSAAWTLATSTLAAEAHSCELPSSLPPSTAERRALNSTARHAGTLRPSPRRACNRGSRPDSVSTSHWSGRRRSERLLPIAQSTHGSRGSRHSSSIIILTAFHRERGTITGQRSRMHRARHPPASQTRARSA